MYFLATMPSTFPIIPVAPNGEPVGEQYMFQARAILDYIIGWMGNTTILVVGGVSITFTVLLVGCLAYRIIVAIIHHFIDGLEW